MRLDHIMVAASDLDWAIATVAEATGVTAAVGGAHPGQGSHNALASFGNGSYLELIAPDPNQSSGPMRDRFADLDGLHVATWIARSDGAEGAVEAMGKAGLEGKIHDLSRATPAGETLRWRMVSIHGHDAGPVMPLLIDWGDTPHPSTTQPSGLSLERFTVVAPDAERVRAEMARAGIEVDVVEGDAPRYEAVITGPAGSLTITGNARLMDV